MKNNNKRLVFVGKARDLMAFLAHFKITNGHFEVVDNPVVDIC